jgi:Cu+-exporting ATPase
MQPDDRLRVRPGEKSRWMGLVEGRAPDESMVTGEPLPSKAPGSRVTGGTVTGTGGFVMRAGAWVLRRSWPRSCAW